MSSAAPGAAITGVQIPIGFVCSFFEDFECADDGSNGHDRADILPGTWNMFDVEGVSGTENFNDLTSSISCSAI
ncbi:hypothetical protein DFH09DRAFT_1320889 [Mycena vulgaris]|nr:hypothetical protein DFH09DRAFT_1320889 [Mycena vulgaris]